MMDFREWLWWMWIFGAGFGIGLFFFGALWLTVSRLTTAPYPGALFLLSFYARMAVSVVAIYLVAGEHVVAALVSVMGFLAARLTLVHLSASSLQAGATTEGERIHAADS